MKLPLLFPRVEPPASYPPTWEDIERLAHNHPTVRTVVALHQRGDLTREQALISAVFALADAHQKAFEAEVERRRVTLDPIFIMGDDILADPFASHRRGSTDRR